MTCVLHYIVKRQPEETFSSQLPLQVKNTHNSHIVQQLTRYIYFVNIGQVGMDPEHLSVY